MASTQKKTTGTGKKPAASGGTKKTASKAASGRSKKPTQSQKKPIRREVGGIVLLVLDYLKILK